ncbi:hypothetical protein ES708_20579 [subsurface metagenome]
MAWLNGVPCVPGPAPNERLGFLDIFVQGTAHSKYDPRNYGGGHLFRDMIEGKEIYVECESDDGRYFESHFKLEQLDFARIYSMRNCYRNYMCFSNLKDLPTYKNNPVTIFAYRFMPVNSGISMVGSGEMNPLQNDPNFRMIRIGTKILVNKAPGIIVGCGTRSDPTRPTISAVADMFEMDPEFMGGFRTSAAVEVTNSLSIPIPMLDQEAIDTVAQALDENIVIPLADMGDRVAMSLSVNYGDIWTNADLEFEFDSDKCVRCSQTCIAEYYCPMHAINWQTKTLDQDKCFHCGACNINCPGGVFKPKEGDYKGHMGLVYVKELDVTLPVTFRETDRLRSQKLAEYLKEMLQRGGYLFADTDFMVTMRPRGF